jgi:hypothetical protein
MENNTLKPAAPVPDDLDNTASAVAAARNLKACRRNTGALRIMFGVCSTEVKPAETLPVKIDPALQKQRLISPLPSPKI